MVVALSATYFPPLNKEDALNSIRPSTGTNGSIPLKQPLICNRKAQLFTNNDKGKEFSLSYVPADSVDVNFSESDVNEGNKNGLSHWLVMP